MTPNFVYRARLIYDSYPRPPCTLFGSGSRPRNFSSLLGSTMIEDLSRYHHPVSTLFARSSAPSDWEQYRLSAGQLEFFRENGYLKGVRILSDEQVEVLRTELELLMDPAHP